MATEFTLPDLGENITSGDVVSVLVKVGDVVSPGQAVLEVETDKAVIEVPCPPGGVIQEVLRQKRRNSKRWSSVAIARFVRFPACSI